MDSHQGDNLISHSNFGADNVLVVKGLSPFIIRVRIHVRVRARFRVPYVGDECIRSKWKTGVLRVRNSGSRTVWRIQQLVEM